MNMQVEKVEQVKQAGWEEVGVGSVGTSSSGGGADARWPAEVHAEYEAREWDSSVGEAVAMIGNAVGEFEARAEQVPDSQRDRVLFELEAAYKHLKYEVRALPAREVAASEHPPC